MGGARNCSHLGCRIARTSNFINSVLVPVLSLVVLALTSLRLKFSYNLIQMGRTPTNCHSNRLTMYPSRLYFCKVSNSWVSEGCLTPVAQSHEVDFTFTFFLCFCMGIANISWPARSKTGRIWTGYSLIGWYHRLTS